MRCRDVSARGVALVDVLAIGAAFLGTAAMLLLLGANQRRLARLGEDVSHLRRIGALTGQYLADNAELFWTFSWRRGHTQTQYPDLNGASGDVDAAALQAVYILRTRAGRGDMPRINQWFAHILYSGLVLQDYADLPFPDRMFVSSGDEWRLRWATDPACFDAHCFACQPVPGPEQKRWPYSASFTPGIAFFDRSTAGQGTWQLGVYNQYLPGTAFGGAPMAEVAHPSQKVMVTDQNARHFGSRQPYCTHEEARLPLLMVDGSVPVRSAADANPGWDPHYPMYAFAMSYWYGGHDFPCWDPPPLQEGGDPVKGRFRYTRGGIAGRDFGGPEVP